MTLSQHDPAWLLDPNSFASAEDSYLASCEMPIAIFRAGSQCGSLVVVPSNYNYVATENTLYVFI